MTLIHIIIFYIVKVTILNLHHIETRKTRINIMCTKTHRRSPVVPLKKWDLFSRPHVSHIGNSSTEFVKLCMKSKYETS